VRWESLFGDAVSIVTTLVTLILLINIVLAIITMFRERREPSSLWAWNLVMFSSRCSASCSGCSSGAG